MALAQVPHEICKLVIYFDPYPGSDLATKAVKWSFFCVKHRSRGIFFIEFANFSALFVAYNIYFMTLRNILGFDRSTRATGKEAISLSWLANELLSKVS